MNQEDSISGNTGGVYLVLGNGDGTFEPSLYYPTGTGDGYLLVADFNRDGSPDAVLSDFWNNNLDLFLNVHGTQMHASSSQNPSTVGQAITFSARVTASQRRSQVAPTGMVTFKDGADLLAVVPLVGGTARYTTSTLSAGSHLIRSAYSGDESYNRSRPTQHVQIVKQP